MKIVNFDCEKDKKEYSTRSLLEDLKKIHEEDGIEMMAVVYKKKDGTFNFGTTYGNQAEFIGLFEMGKIHLFNEMNE